MLYDLTSKLKFHNIISAKYCKIANAQNYYSLKAQICIS